MRPLRIPFALTTWTVLLVLAGPRRVHARFRFGARSSVSLKTSLLTLSKLQPHKSSPLPVDSPLWIRGGSTKPPAAKTSSTKDDLHAYRLQQQLYLQSRSLQLRQALIQRGFTELQHSETEQTAQIVDWDCAMATKSSPKSCLYSFDAETDTKVIAPIDTEQWITLAALNRLRRNDPTKVEPLWHSQYLILQSWFHPNASPYSLYTHLSPAGTLLSCLLDAPYLLGATMLLAAGIIFLIAMPLWESLAKIVALNSLVWMNWYQWARFVHAALPLKLLLGQMVWKGLASVFGRIYRQIRSNLVEWECQILENCVPLTVLEAGAEENSSPSNGVSGETEGGEEEWLEVEDIVDDEDLDEDED